MKLVSIRNHQDWQMYGYQIEGHNGIWWSMKVYSGVWHIPMSHIHDLINESKQ